MSHGNGPDVRGLPQTLEARWQSFILSCEYRRSLRFLEKAVCFLRELAYDPTRPTVLPKRGGDHFVRAYGETYQYILSFNCSNNYNHYPEKLIRYLSEYLQEKPLPVYGDGNPRLVICS
jgi:hypothetical protein